MKSLPYLFQSFKEVQLLKIKKVFFIFLFSFHYCKLYAYVIHIDTLLFSSVYTYEVND